MIVDDAAQQIFDLAGRECGTPSCSSCRKTYTAAEEMARSLIGAERERCAKIADSVYAACDECQCCAEGREIADQIRGSKWGVGRMVTWDFKAGFVEYEAHDPSCRFRGRGGRCSYCNKLDEQRRLDQIAILAEYEG